MRMIALSLALMLCLAGALTVNAGEVPVESETDQILYALGFAVAQNISAFQFTEAELAVVQKGFADAVLGKTPELELLSVGPKIDGYLQGRMAEVSEREKGLAKEFQTKMAAEEGAVTTDSGMVYRELEPGTGASPGATDTVKIDYVGTLRDGKVFDSSTTGPDPAPATFALNRVIPCFGEGVRRMKVGGKSKLTCPAEIAYGDRGSPPNIMPGATLVFEITLLEIVPPAVPAPTP